MQSRHLDDVRDWWNDREETQKAWIVETKDEAKRVIQSAERNM